MIIPVFQKEALKPRLIPVFLPIPEQEIMIDRFVEQLLESGHVTGLAQGPHGLGYGGFQGHIVGLDEIKLILHHLSDLIDSISLPSWVTWVAIMTIFPEEMNFWIISWKLSSP